MRGILITASIILFSHQAMYSQINLVPNPGFSVYSICPSGQNHLNYAIPWFNPSVMPGSPDFWHTCSNAVPSNSLGFYQADHTNTNGGYAGIVSYAPGSNWREYLEVELLNPLLSDSLYCVEMVVSLSEQCGIAISNLGIYFSDSAMYLSTNFNFPVIPHFENPDSNILLDYANWMTIRGYYVAHGGEKYILLGNFRDSASTNYLLLNQNLSQFAYYLVDDISVNLCDSTIAITEKALGEAINISPNPFVESIHIKYSRLAANSKINIFSSTGKLHLVSEYKEILNLSQLPSGFYILELMGTDWHSMKKIVKR
jgi:hypothetical protein